jgi:large subunit ribosomal protein L9
MEVILTKDIKGLGKTQEVVKVKDGFARNFLLPKGFALLATEKNLKEIAELEKIKAQEKEKEKRLAMELAARLNNTSVNVTVAVNEEEKLYGSVTNLDIANALKEEGFDIEEDNILLDEPIKNLGIYDIAVKLHPEIQAKIKVWIVKK